MRGAHDEGKQQTTDRNKKTEYIRSPMRSDGEEFMMIFINHLAH